MDECDELLVQSLKDIQERSHQRQAQRDDMDTNFCLEVAGRLKRLAPKENAFVKLKIQHLLFEVEFANNASAMVAEMPQPTVSSIPPLRTNEDNGNLTLPLQSVDAMSRSSDTVYHSAGFDHMTGVSGDNLDINARHSVDAGRADRQDVLTKHSTWQAGHHSNPQTTTNTIRVMAKRISHSFNSNPQTPTNLLKPKAPSSSSFQRDPSSPLVIDHQRDPSSPVVSDHQRDPTSPFVTDHQRDPPSPLRDPHSPFVTDHQRDPPSPFVTDYERDTPAPFVTDHQRDPTSPIVADHQRDPTSPLVTDCHRDPTSPLVTDCHRDPPSPFVADYQRDPPSSYQRDRLSLPSSVAAGFGATEPPAGDGMTSPLPVATDKMLEQHHRLKGEKNAGSRAIKLAKDALFGDEVLKLCTPMGN
ncbi:hypothetical protein EMCRGX_G005852 [Ephydatia muelleri]